ncbi:MAG: class I SAM-dependent methyltransferase [Aigarchaeota archaeon]|nr:class I SAM-dependent methyltransferase [Candidatus Pelearchaeum maunauluense]
MILDVGSGHNPRGDVNVDLYRDWTPHTFGKKVVRKNLVQADAHMLPFRDSCFDVVLSFHLLEHLDNPIQELREFERVSRHRVIVAVPHPIHEIIVRLFGKPNPKHKCFFS